jgi:quercetin dioxygenase-like cupin family protein
MARLFIILAAVCAVTFGVAYAQEKNPADDKQKSAGTETKSLLENEQMRVVEIRFKPGAKTATLSHPNRFVYALTDGALVFSPPGKTPYELSFKSGEALWLPAESTATENDSDKDVRTLVVEMKGGARVSPLAAGAMAKGKAAKSKGKKYAKSAKRARPSGSKR